MHLLKAFKTVWIIYSAAALLSLLAAIFLPSYEVLKYSPACYSVTQYNRECFMCGSTRSFILAGEGNFANAVAMNKLAAILFILFAINSFILIFHLLTKPTKNKS